MSVSQWKEKIFANLDKICLDPIGNIANSEAVEKYWSWGEYYDSGEAKKHGQYRIKTEAGEEIDLMESWNSDSWWEDYAEIRTAIINNIKQNPTDWEIFADGSNSQRGNFLKNKKNGVKTYKSGITIFMDRVDDRDCDEEKGQKDWKEIEAIVKKVNPGKNNPPTKSNPTKNEPAKKWYKPSDYPLLWVTIITLTFIFIVTVIIFVRKPWKRRNS